MAALKDLNKKLSQQFFEMSRFERESYDSGFRCVVGVDEVGRGPLAGPVVAVACFLPQDAVFLGLNDSKQMTPDRRKRIQEEIISDDRVAYGLGMVDAEEIDKINILEATKRAMVKAVASCPVLVDLLLVDGLSLDGCIPIPSRKIIKGDALSVSIAAASVLAKEYRDDMMIKYHEEYPEYGFDRHKGYGTRLHIESLEKFGVTPIHRKTFAPVARILSSKGLHLREARVG